MNLTTQLEEQQDQEPRVRINYIISSWDDPNYPAGGTTGSGTKGKVKLYYFQLG